MNTQEFAKKLGIKGISKKPVGVINPLIEEAVEDLNTWLLAKSNAKKDMKQMGIDSEKIGANKGKLYRGNHPISGEKIYK